MKQPHRKKSDLNWLQMPLTDVVWNVLKIVMFIPIIVWRSSRSNPTGFYLALAVLFTVMVRCEWISICKSKAIKMGNELGSPGDFWGPPKPNHANTRIFFGERSENGVSFYISDLSGHKTLVCELAQADFKYSHLRSLGWSPDDKFLAYAYNGSIFVCDGNSGKELHDTDIGGPLDNFVWLSPSSMIAFNGVTMYMVKEEEGWTKRAVFKIEGAESISNLTRNSGESISWKQDNEVWSFYLRDRFPKKVWASKDNPILDFSYSEESEVFLFNCATNGGSLRGVSRFSDRPSVVELRRMDIPNAYIFNVCSINSGKGYTYLTSDTAEKDIRPASPSLNNTLFVKKDADSQPVQILGEKGIVDYTLNGGELFIIGSLTNEPCGIWRYNVKSGYLDRIYSSLPSSKYAKFITPQFYSITNVQGKVVNYHLWPPANMLSHKKYPLMIGQTSYRWLAEAQVAANSGCYFAIADRPTFGSDKIDNWSEDVMSVYLDLEKNATVNIHHVYLFGTSIEGSYLSALMQEKSELWKGAFLEGATGPLLAQDRNLEMAIVVGNHDVRLDSVQKYVTRAAWNGVPIKAVLRNGSHKAIATSTPKANCRALAEFLLRNK